MISREQHSESLSGRTPHEHAEAEGLVYRHQKPSEAVPYAPDVHVLEHPRGKIAWAGHTEKKPGVIAWVEGSEKGVASNLHRVAREMSSEHGMPMPKHSNVTTKQGRKWARKEKRKYRGKG